MLSLSTTDTYTLFPLSGLKRLIRRASDEECATHLVMRRELVIHAEEIRRAKPKARVVQSQIVQDAPRIPRPANAQEGSRRAQAVAASRTPRRSTTLRLCSRLLSHPEAASEARRKDAEQAQKWTRRRRRRPTTQMRGLETAPGQSWSRDERTLPVKLGWLAVVELGRPRDETQRQTPNATTNAPNATPNATPSLP